MSTNTVSSRILPQHIAIVMDGNGRWAKKRLLPRQAGHLEGVKALKKVIQACLEFEVQALTVFAFSSENWRRPEKEVNALMELFLSCLQDEVEPLHEHGIRINFLGAIETFQPKLRENIQAAQNLTQRNNKLVLNVALGYGGRWDIAQACRQLCKKVESGEIDSHRIDEVLLSQHLTTYPFDEPDLFIRTAGEQRLSNFLIWQLAYTELYFTDVLWPDFDADKLENAIEHFSYRQRKFGLTQEQVDANKT